MTQEMLPTKLETLAKVADICAKKGVRDVIISPGSRSAPLTISFARHPDVRCRVVMDERAAAFIALGIAQQTRQPVGLICTSGTAVLNYGPAVAEAFYQQIPLLVFTADRPPEWIDQQDGQTIHQQHIFGPHCRASFELPVDTSHADARWHAERLISEAVNLALWPLAGPVHVNVPLREPFYPTSARSTAASLNYKAIQLATGQPRLTQETWAHLLAHWRAAPKKLVIAGLHPPKPSLAANLFELQQDPAVAVIGDITANIHQTGTQLVHADMILGSKSIATLEKLRPDLVISYGGPVVSKYLKLFLRKYRPEAHWQIQPDGQPIDTFQALTQVITVNPSYFFDALVQQQEPQFSQNKAHSPDTYQVIWRGLETQARQAMSIFLGNLPFGEFSAVAAVMESLPAHSHLQLGNSMPIRYASFFGLGGDKGTTIRVNANRGTSGIDGTLSTAVGAAMSTNRITTLITGDLAFFYDRNALWHNHVPANLRIVILNNRGGGIFKLIDGPNNLTPDELETYFFTPQPLTARHTAADHNCAYFYCNSAADLAQQLPKFFSPGPRAAILEIETDSTINTQVFQKFKATLANLEA